MIILENSVSNLWHWSTQGGGWNFVCNQLLHNVQGMNKLLDNEDVIVDTFLDKTFLWSPEKDIIVYNKPWIGVLHHPRGVHNSCAELFKSKNFIDSLSHCIGIIVFSQHLQNQLEGLVHENSLHKFPEISVLCHPVPKISSRFVSPRKRILVHIGSHGRIADYFYNVSAPNYTKYMLTNNSDIPLHMCTDYSSTNTAFFKKKINNIRRWMQRDELKGISQTFGSFSPAFPFHPLPSPPPHVRGALLSNGAVRFPPGCKHDKVIALPRLSAHEYFSVLQQSVVYIHLKDASAVNTLLECVVVRTPIIINRHPAVVEILGVGYPLYADSSDEAAYILEERPEMVSEGVRYLSTIDIEQFNYKHFQAGVDKIINRMFWRRKMSEINQEMMLLPPMPILPEGGSLYKEAMADFERIRTEFELIALF